MFETSSDQQSQSSVIVVSNQNSYHHSAAAAHNSTNGDIVLNAALNEASYYFKNLIDFHRHVHFSFCHNLNTMPKTIITNTDLTEPSSPTSSTSNTSTVEPNTSSQAPLTNTTNLDKSRIRKKYKKRKFKKNSLSRLKSCFIDKNNNNQENTPLLFASPSSSSLESTSPLESLSSSSSCLLISNELSSRKSTRCEEQASNCSSKRKSFCSRVKNTFKSYFKNVTKYLQQKQAAARFKKSSNNSKYNNNVNRKIAFSKQNNIKNRKKFKFSFRRFKREQQSSKIVDTTINLEQQYVYTNSCFVNEQQQQQQEVMVTSANGSNLLFESSNETLFYPQFNNQYNNSNNTYTDIDMSQSQTTSTGQFFQLEETSQSSNVLYTQTNSRFLTQDLLKMSYDKFKQFRLNEKLLQQTVLIRNAIKMLQYELHYQHEQEIQQQQQYLYQQQQQQMLEYQNQQQAYAVQTNMSTCPYDTLEDVLNRPVELLNRHSNLNSNFNVNDNNKTSNEVDVEIEEEEEEEEEEEDEEFINTDNNNTNTNTQVITDLSLLKQEEDVLMNEAEVEGHNFFV